MFKLIRRLITGNPCDLEEEYQVIVDLVGEYKALVVSLSDMIESGVTREELKTRIDYIEFCKLYLELRGKIDTFNMDYRDMSSLERFLRPHLERKVSHVTRIRTRIIVPYVFIHSK